MNGYIPVQRTRDIEATFEVAEGAEPLRATIVTSLTFAEIDAIPISGSWLDVFAAIAPYVVAWNVMGRNTETGEYEPLPPPAEAGPDVFLAAPIEVASFLVVKLKTVHLGADDPKGLSKLTPSDGTPDGRPETSTTSKPAKSRKSRRAST